MIFMTVLLALLALFVGILLTFALSYAKNVVSTQYTDPATGIMFRRCWNNYTRKQADAEAHELWRYYGHAVHVTGPDNRGYYHVWYSVGQTGEATG